MRAILIVASLVLVVGYVVNVESRLARLRVAVLLEGEMKTEWTSGGERKSVVTYREPGESNADWLARHVEAVQTKQAEFPPD